MCLVTSLGSGPHARSRINETTMFYLWRISGALLKPETMEADRIPTNIIVKVYTQGYRARPAVPKKALKLKAQMTDDR